MQNEKSRRKHRKSPPPWIIGAGERGAPRWRLLPNWSLGLAAACASASLVVIAVLIPSMKQYHTIMAIIGSAVGHSFGHDA
jgi:hypothetical protein